MVYSAPPLLEMIGALIREPSVSSVRPDLDQGNRGVIALLADWLELEKIKVSRRGDFARKLATRVRDAASG